MTTEERIREQAKIFGHSFYGTETLYEERSFRHGYESGAKSERNKTIDEAIDIVTDYQDYNPLIIERLKAMKI